MIRELRGTFVYEFIMNLEHLITLRIIVEDCKNNKVDVSFLFCSL